jgi:hypothetical protein
MPVVELSLQCVFVSPRKTHVFSAILGLGDGVGVGEGVGLLVGVAEGRGDGLGVGDGVALPPGEGEALPPGDGETLPPGDGEAVAGARGVVFPLPPEPLHWPKPTLKTAAAADPNRASFAPDRRGRDGCESSAAMLGPSSAHQEARRWRSGGLIRRAFMRVLRPSATY